MNAPSQEQIRETILRTLSEVAPDANTQTLIRMGLKELSS